MVEESSSGLGLYTPPPKHTLTVGGVPFEVDLCYTPYKLIGRGAHGLVCAARADPAVAVPAMDDEPDDGEVAIKKIKSVFTPGANFIEAKRTLREICLLRHMRHENVLSIRDVLLPSSPESFSDVYLVVEKMDSDMHQIIQVRTQGGLRPWRAPNSRGSVLLACPPAVTQ
jgi:mitogen-activated protein kinase 1/3